MEWYATLAVGFFLIGFGAWFVQRHFIAINKFQLDSELTEKQKSFLVSQQKRRLFTSCLVIVTGILIPASYYAIEPLKNAFLASLLLLTLLILIVVICIFAISDMLSNRYFRQDIDLKRAETELKRRVLESELEKHQQLKADMLKNEIRRNGHS